MTEYVENIYMVRKPTDLEEIISVCRNKRFPYLETVEVAETIKLSQTQYDKLAQRPFAKYDFLAGKGGYKNDKRQVVKIIAPDRLTLYVDPSGAAYCRYAGIVIEEKISVKETNKA